MAYNSTNILVDAGSKPIPQYWDSATSNYMPMGKDMEIAPTGVQVYDSFTRVAASATTYAAGDIMSSSSSVNYFVWNVGSGLAGKLVNIYGTMVLGQRAAVPTGNAGGRLHYFSAAPTVTTDNAAFSLASSDFDAYGGYSDVGMMLDLGANIAAVNDNVNHTIKLATSNLYGYYQLKGAESCTGGETYTAFLNIGGI